MIEVKNLVKMYDGHLAVDHLNFTVEKGQILGFLGPNGAGKSTTMNMLTGYISATEGTITINGYDIYEEPEEAKRCIGYLPELPPVYPDMTVREYLKFVMELKKVPKKERAAMLEDVMERTALTDVADRLIKHLSKGYRQRVGLAQAITGYPEVIILDEPTVGLDPMQIIEIRDLIRELAEKHTVIISSHILSEISAVCDTVMIINKGKLIVTDRVENLPKHLKGASSLKLEVRAKKEQLAQILGGIAAIEAAEYAPGRQEKLCQVTITTQGNTDIREELFFALAEADCPIYELSVSNMSLEDIFLEVTKEDAAMTENDVAADDATQHKDNAADAGSGEAAEQSGKADTMTGEEKQDDSDL